MKRPPNVDEHIFPRIGLTRTEAAEALGISVRTLDSLISDRANEFPIVRIGRKVVIPRTALEDWLLRQQVQQGGR